MEAVRILLQDRDFDRIVHTGLPEAGDLAFALKRRGTTCGKAVVAIGFTVQLPDGTTKPVQAVTTLANFTTAARALQAASTGREVS